MNPRFRPKSCEPVEFWRFDLDSVEPARHRHHSQTQAAALDSSIINFTSSQIVKLESIGRSQSSRRKLKKLELERGSIGACPGTTTVCFISVLGKLAKHVGEINLQILCTRTVRLFGVTTQQFLHHDEPLRKSEDIWFDSSWSFFASTCVKMNAALAIEYIEILDLVYGITSDCNKNCKPITQISQYLFSFDDSNVKKTTSKPLNLNVKTHGCNSRVAGIRQFHRAPGRVVELGHWNL